MELTTTVARRALELGAIKLNTKNPFTWASGYRMPIYNDNRQLLFADYDRKIVALALAQLTTNIEYDIIAGTATAGISPATTLANKLYANLIYVRDKAKDHGMQNQIEGATDISDKTVIMVEDLISTGGSSIRAIEAIREAGGICNNCISIFSYGLDKAKQAFKSMSPPCEAHAILDYNTLIDFAKKSDHITDDQYKMLQQWREDPFGWGEKHGFTRVEQ